MGINPYYLGKLIPSSLMWIVQRLRSKSLCTSLWHSCLAENTDIKLNSVGVNKQWESHVQAWYVLCYDNKIKKTPDQRSYASQGYLEKVKKNKRLMHNAARDMGESGIEAVKRSRKRQCHP